VIKGDIRWSLFGHHYFWKKGFLIVSISGVYIETGEETHEDKL
jgi:hypothetical protein